MIRTLLACAAVTAAAPSPAAAQTAAQTAVQAAVQTTSPAATTVVMEHVSVRAYGRGSPVILIPGLSSPAAVWDGVVPTLAAKHRVFVVQVNGFGGDAPRANLVPGILDGIVADLHALVIREKLRGAAVVGHSMGGLAALMLAKAHPGDTGRLMIVDALPYVGEIFVPGATVAMLEPQARAMRGQMAQGYGKPADPVAAQSIAERLALKPGSRALVAGWSTHADPRVAAQAMYEDMTTDLRGDVGAIAAPTTIVYAYAAEGLPQPRADALYRGAYRAMPHVRFVGVDGSAHFVMLDQPAAFAAALEAFLAP